MKLKNTHFYALTETKREALKNVSNQNSVEWIVQYKIFDGQTKCDYINISMIIYSIIYSIIV